MELNAQSLIAQTLSAAHTAKADKAVAAVQSPDNMAKIEDAAREFEAVFISQMLGHMFEGIETDGMFGGGHAETVYRGMLTNEYGQIMAQAGGIGLADSIKAQMIAMQEGSLS